MEKNILNIKNNSEITIRHGNEQYILIEGKEYHYRGDLLLLHGFEFQKGFYEESKYIDIIFTKIEIPKYDYINTYFILPENFTIKYISNYSSGNKKIIYKKGELKEIHFI